MIGDNNRYCRPSCGRFGERSPHRFSCTARDRFQSGNSSADGSLSRAQNVRRHQIMAVPMKELSPPCPWWHARPSHAMRNEMYIWWS